MIHTIIFSKNRATQLDQLLQSIEARARGLFDPIDVLWTATTSDYMLGYQFCQLRFRKPKFSLETSFQAQLNDLIHRSEQDQIVFLCDDDLVTHVFTDEPPPSILLNNERVLTISLRLGLNTTECYPLRSPQRTPEFIFAIKDALVWSWPGADGDWGYPGSLDGHVFRRDDLVEMLANKTYSGPNRLEEALVSACRGQQELMACYRQSIVTGCPLNLVNESHLRNRHSKIAGQDEATLNARYLDGYLPRLPAPTIKQINAAHAEIPVVLR